MRDLNDYDSPFVSITGSVPYNGYLWPTESWWPSHDPEIGGRGRNFFRFHFGIVALKDGRFATDGHDYLLSANSTVPAWEQSRLGPGNPVIYTDRITAIRTAAARMIREARWSLSWGSNGLSDYELEILVNWTLKKVSEASSCKWEPITIFKREHPKPSVKAGQLDLFDYAQEAANL